MTGSATLTIEVSMMTMTTASTNTTVTAAFWSGCRRASRHRPGERDQRAGYRLPDGGHVTGRPPPERLDADHPPGRCDDPGARLCQHVIQVSPGLADVVPGHQHGGGLPSRGAIPRGRDSQSMAFFSAAHMLPL
jgi:hypothetical protein